MKNIIESATIKPDGSVGHEMPDVFQVFLVETPQGSFWFEGGEHYAENGNDFRMEIRNFGLVRKTAAGSRTPLVRRAFSAAEAKAAEALAKTFFLGSEQAGIPPFSAWPGSQAHCIGIDFVKGWIIVRYHETVRKSEDAYHALFIETRKGSFWIEVEYRFEDGADFRVTIEKFILRRPMIPLFPTYTADEVSTARGLVQRFFMGRAAWAPGIFGPFRIGNGRCLGVTFAESWVATSA